MKVNVVEQPTFTGVKDVNGKEIKNGDRITSYLTGQKDAQLVTFKDGAFRFGITGLVLSKWCVDSYRITL